MAENTTDRRVRKTRGQLRQGLVRLMREKSIQDITVKELCEDCDINRGTCTSFCTASRTSCWWSSSACWTA